MHCMCMVEYVHIWSICIWIKFQSNWMKNHENEQKYDQLIKKRNLEDEYFKRFNYEDYGGTPILGLEKPIIIGHGISNEIAIKNMILLTKNVIEADLEKKIKQTLK